MLRVRVSRRVNWIFGGKKDEMLSSRLYLEDRRTLIFVVDTVFFILRKERKHCEVSCRWETQEKRRKKTKDKT